MMLVLGWLCSALVVMFLVAVAALGSASLESLELALRLRHAADAVVARTGGAASLWTDSQRESVRLMGAGRVVDVEAARQAEDRTAVGLAAFVGAGDVSTFLGEVARRRRGYAKGAARRHAAVASRWSTLWWVARAWVLTSVLIRVDMAVRGGAWVVRQGLSHWGRLAAQIFGMAAVGGTVTGLLWWMLFESDGDADGSKWVNSVGVASAIVAAAAAGIFVLRTFSMVITATWGPPGSWTLKGVLLGVSTISVPTVMLVLHQTGTLRLLDQSMAQSVGNWQGTSTASFLVGMAMAVGVVVLVVRSFRAARRRDHSLAERAGALVCAVFFLWLAACFSFFALGAPVELLLPSLPVLGVVLVTGVVLVAVLSAASWVGRYRELRAAGWFVATRGFRWWMPVAWIGAVASMMVAEALSTWMRSIDGHWLIIAWAQWMTLVLSPVIVIGALVVTVLGALFCSSVSKAHKVYLASRSS